MANNDTEIFNPAKQTLLGLNAEELQYELSIRKIKSKEYTQVELEELHSKMSQEVEPWKIPTNQSVTKEVELCRSKIVAYEKWLASRPAQVD